MVGACLTSVMALILATPPDVSALVGRLGSAVPADREQAARELEAIGRDALPALLAVRDSPDPEFRDRAAALWDRIQRGLMVRPTMIRLDGEARSLPEVVRSIGQQTGFSLQVSHQGSDHLVNAREAAPVPFWRAVDQLGLSGGHFDNTNPIGGHFPNLSFQQGTGDACPTTTAGPFRIKLTGLHDHRDRMLISGPWLRIDQMQQRIPSPRGSKEREGRFYVDLALMIEPRMWFTQEGPARAIEAIDDLGQSLVLAEGEKVKANYSLIHNSGGVTAGNVELDLTMPAKPGRTIALLRGVVPVALHLRRPVPSLEVPLEKAEGKAFAADDADFTIRKVSDGPQGTGVMIAARLDLDRAELPAGHDRALVNSRQSTLMHHQVEIVDDRGTVVADFASGSPGQMSLMVWKNRTTGRPIRFRYYSMIRAFTDVAFEFRNIPMP